VLGAGACAAAGGTYQGFNTTCNLMSCPGACCFATGMCQFIGGGACTVGGGTYQGLGVPCTPASCPGACCFPDFSCQELSLADCLAAGGDFTAFGIACTPTQCVPQPARVGCEIKGSFIVFSKVELRWGGAAPFPLLQDTFISLTNDVNEAVRVQLYFVNGDAPLAPVFDGGGALIERGHPGWNWMNNQFTLTANQPTYWSAFTGQPAVGGLSPFGVLDPGSPPGRPANDGSGDRVLRGFILAWAVNAQGQEIRWNHLAGNATIVHYGAGFAWEYNACAFQTADDSIPNGGQTGTPGMIMLDGVEFAQAADQLLFNFQAAGSQAFGVPPAPRLVISDTDLTLHPYDTDLRQATTGPVTTKASFTIWNQNEVKFSGEHVCVTCWDQTLISRYASIPNHFLRLNLQTDHGKARIDGLAAPQCAGSVDAAMNGVYARILAFDGGAAFGAAGGNLVGMGFQSAQIKYDLPAPSQELQLPHGADLWQKLNFVDSAIEIVEAGGQVQGGTPRRDQASERR
jgi:hypothetical protein